MEVVITLSYVVVTGASSGIGEAICHELGKLKFNLVVVARNLDKLEELKDELEKKYQIRVVVLKYDLSDLEKLKDLHQECQQYEIIGLVNNAGYGLFGTFQSLELEDELNLIDVNIKSLHILSKLFLKDFITKEKGYLLNVASTAAFQSGPLMASYYASKAYVLNLTEAIAGEIKESYPNIIISVLCPGPVATNFQKRAAISVAGKRVPSAEEVAKYGINQWFKGKVLIIPQFSNRLLVFGNRFIPRSYGRYLVKKNQLKKK